MFDHWKNISLSNFSLFDEVFAVLPNNEVFAMPDKGELSSGRSFDSVLMEHNQIDVSLLN